MNLKKKEEILKKQSELLSFSIFPQAQLCRSHFAETRCWKEKLLRDVLPKTSFHLNSGLHFNASRIYMAWKKQEFAKFLPYVFLCEIMYYISTQDRNPLNGSIFTWIGFYTTLKTYILVVFVQNLSRCRILWFLSVFSITIFRIKRMHVSGNLEVNARVQGKWIGNFRVAIHVTWLAVIFHGNFSRDRSKVKMAMVKEMICMLSEHWVWPVSIND